MFSKSLNSSSGAGSYCWELISDVATLTPLLSSPIISSMIYYSFFFYSCLSIWSALAKFSGNLHIYIMPSVDVVIRCFIFVLRHRAVVTSPHVVLHMTLPVAASYTVTYLSVLEDITTPAFESVNTLIWSIEPDFRELSIRFSITLSQFDRENI